MTSSGAPTERYEQRDVWTGSEVIVWSGCQGLRCETKFTTGERYNPVTNSWSPTSLINVPAGRYEFTAIWTGTEMIIWGGWTDNGNTNTGGRYNPMTNTWTSTSTQGAPSPMNHQTAVRTGTEMIVWGGCPIDDRCTQNTYTGGRYNPSTNSWTSLPTTGAPVGRDHHSAVWTGTEMIVWGGYDNLFYPTQGGIYNPFTDSWRPMANPTIINGRVHHNAVWTGEEVLIWADITVIFRTLKKPRPVTITISTSGFPWPHPLLAPGPGIPDSLPEPR